MTSTATAPANNERWAIWPDGGADGVVSDAVLADRWNGAMWPGGNSSEVALRLYAIIDELAGEVARIDMQESGDTVRDNLDMDGLERVIAEWILEHVGPAAVR